MENSIADVIQAVRHYPPSAYSFGPTSSKLDEKNTTRLAIVDLVDQDGDRHTSKCMKIRSIQPCSGLHTLEDDMVFSDEDLITIDESAKQHRLDVGEIDAQRNVLTGFRALRHSKLALGCIQPCIQNDQRCCSYGCYPTTTHGYPPLPPPIQCPQVRSSRLTYFFKAM
ncbi:Uncharacterized protein Fot_32769 [Forsythia ovata]|uniref:Uncharacterized protein n=1 Tax=Forsythia ovata TaxID=205694 RepID=A0ABD1T8S4_9LAMI